MNEALLSSKNLNWCTPPEFFDELDQEFHFNLDPAATDKCAKCAKYFTPETDGLKADWGGSRVFCNPPYGRNIGEWVKKGYEESQEPGIQKQARARAPSRADPWKTFFLLPSKSARVPRTGPAKATISVEMLVA